MHVAVGAPVSRGVAAAFRRVGQAVAHFMPLKHQQAADAESSRGVVGSSAYLETSIYLSNSTSEAGPHRLTEATDLALGVTYAALLRST